MKIRKEEISKKYPEIIELDNKIQRLSLKMAVSILKSKDSEKNNR
ncbi:hypothetical protein DE151_000006 [Clostridium beijerinckii]|nr:hypothetical protein [Clostridium beijerinckii]